MSDDAVPEGLRERLTRHGEGAAGRLVQELLESPVLHAALSRAFEAREKAAQAQEVAMGALNLPSAADLERLTRRVRSVSQRLEGVEDGVDRLEQRLGAIEQQLARIAEGLAAGDPPPKPKPRAARPRRSGAAGT
jgi:septal ring factor EnvC (AmiA/AmiB activator)